MTVLPTSQHEDEVECPVLVDASARDGLGVFAKRDISRGTRLCYFDGAERPLADVRSEKNMGMVRRWKETDNVLRIGYNTPRTTWGLGQFINDACRPELEFIVEHTMAMGKRVSLEQLKKELEIYDRKSKVTNMVTMGDNYWFYAARNIKAGEEIVMHYGKEFWCYWFISGSCIHQPLHEQTYSVLRICLVALMDPNILEEMASSKDDTRFETLLGQLSLTPFFNRHWNETFSKAETISRANGAPPDAMLRSEAFGFLCKALMME